MLCARFVDKLKDQTARLTGKDKQELLEALTDQATKKILSAHRRHYFLLAEAAVFIVSLGVPYLIHAAFKKRQTGHFGVFSYPHSEKKVDEMVRVIHRHQVPNSQRRS